FERAFAHGGGRAAAVLADGGEAIRFSTALECAACGFAVRDPVPNLFSFNSPLGACEACRGFGRVIDLDLDLVVPDPRRTLAAGALKPWSTKATAWERGELAKFCRRRGIPTDVPWGELDPAQRELVLEGDGRGHYPGVRGWFRWLEGRTYRMHVRVFLSRFRSYRLCPACAGARVKPEALDFRVGGRTIAEVNRMPIGEAAVFFGDLRLPSAQAEAVAGLILAEVRSRLRYLVEAGLEYLTLDRQSRTLSGGELERVDLTTAIGSSLVNTLFVLDEPSIGLHPRDTERLVRVLHRLRDQGNTVVVVEHDPAIIRAADHVIDLGPGACDAIEHAERVTEVLLVDQAAIGSTPRANAATYLRAFDGIRACFARTEEARLRGYTAATFSFNVPGGRCETCTGEGFERIEMQ